MNEEGLYEGGHIDTPLPEKARDSPRVASEPIDTPCPTDGVAARPQPHYPEPRFWRLRQRPNPYFMGRESLMVALHHAFQQHPVVHLHGPLGSGTTQTALAYAFRARPNFDAIFWADGKDPTLLRFDLARAGARLDAGWHGDDPLQAQLDAFKAWMKIHLRWLLIIDGAASFDMVREFLPEKPSGRILLTGPTPLPDEPVFVLPHPPLGQKAACLFLAHRSQQERDAHVSAVVRLFNGATLPIFLAGAYCHVTGTPLREYHERIEATLARHDPPHTGDNLNQAVRGAVELALEHAAVEQPAALELMALCAYLDTEDISLAMLCDGGPFLPPRLSACVSDSEALNATLTLLYRLSLVQFERNSIALHPAVQAATRALLGAEHGFAWLMTALRVVREAFPVESHYRHPIPACSMLVRHVFAVTARSERSNQLREGTGLLLNHVGLYLHACGELDAATSCFQRSIRLAESLYGPRHPAIAARVNSLGVVLQDRTQYSEARACYERAFEVCEAVYGPARDAALGPAHRSMLTMPIRNICQVLELIGDVPAAKAAYRRAVKVFIDVYCWNHPLVAEAMNGLGQLFFKEKNLAVARGYFEKAVQAQENAADPDPGDLGRFLRNVAKCALEEDAFQEAIDLYERALQADRADPGKAGGHIAADLIGKGKACRGLSRYDEAHACFDEALAIFESRASAPTREQAQVWRQKGRTCMDSQDYEKAVDYLNRALALTRSAEGRDAAAQGPEFFYLGRALARLERLPEAETALVAALDLHRKTSWMDTETLNALYTRLARVLKDQRKIDRAITLFEDALEHERERHGAGHESVGAVAYHLGNLYLAAYEYEAALEHLQRSLEIYEATRGRKDARTQRILQRIEMVEDLV